jgi:hypothetical protein
MQGYPYQRLPNPRIATQPPTPQSVGQMLVSRNQGPPPLMADAMGGGMSPGGTSPEGGAPHEAMEAQIGAPPMGAPMPGAPMAGMGAMPFAAPARVKALGMDGDYDPTTEHSPSATRAALDVAVRAAMGRVKGSQSAPAPTSTREMLLRLGVPMLEVDLQMKSGVLGDPD